MSGLTRSALEQDPRAYVKDSDIYELEQEQLRKAQAGKGILKAAFAKSGQQKPAPANAKPAEDRYSDRYYSGPNWTLEQTVRLSSIEFRQLERRLPILPLRSVELAIEYLNSGRAVCREGVCLVLSSYGQQDEGFLLYRVGTEDKVFNFLLREIGVDRRRGPPRGRGGYTENGRARSTDNRARSTERSSRVPNGQASGYYYDQEPVPVAGSVASRLPPPTSGAVGGGGVPPRRSQYVPPPSAAPRPHTPPPPMVQVPTGGRPCSGYDEGSPRTAIIAPLVVGKWCVVQGSEIATFDNEEEAKEKFDDGKMRSRILFDPFGKEVAKGHNPVHLGACRTTYKKKRKDQLASTCTCGRDFEDDENFCRRCSRLRPLRGEWLVGPDGGNATRIEGSQLGAYGGSSVVDM